jgi:hypothetical protein
VLVERVIGTWLLANQLEGQFAKQSSVTLAQGLYYYKCITAAHKRHLSAVKALADVRLAHFALQVNIARRQVTITAGAGSAA